MGSFLVTSDSDSGIQALLNVASSGSSQDLGRLLECFRPALMELAELNLSEQLRRRMSLSDLVQDTMLAACHGFHEFRGGTSGELREWLYRVFYSRLIDGFRRHEKAERRRQTLEDHTADTGVIADCGETPSAVVSLQEEAMQLLNSLQQLPEDAQRLISMRYLENKSFESISESTGVPLATVWRKFQSAVQQLHDQLYCAPQ
jgi:RNA polymerase sigma-70 factor (ECF subfamily)